MSDNFGPLDRLIAELKKLPGIGAKSATRLAFFLLKRPVEEAVALADAIVEMKNTIGHCSICFNISTGDQCRICTDPKRDNSIICVVEHPQDLIAIERTAEYRGLFHVLLGALSPISGIGPEDLTVSSLRKRVAESDGGIQEIIIATNPTSDGEATAFFILEELKELDVAISRIAQGLPVGSNLEHVDDVTMARSILTRRRLY